MATPLTGRPHMPGYGVPDSNDGVLPWSWAEDLIRECRIFFIGTARPSGRPHMMPLWGVWSDGLFVFSTAITSVKSENLKKNPNITIGCGHGSKGFVLDGVARIVELDEVPDFVNAYRKKYDYKIESGPVWGVDPKVAFGFVEDDSFARTATRWRWEL